MALDFTNIPDRAGAAVYVLGDGSSQNERELLHFSEEIDKLTPEDTHIVYLDSTRGDGLATKQFYGIQQFPCVMVVMDDDTVPQQWNGTLPRPDEVVYALSHINGSLRSS